MANPVSSMHEKHLRVIASIVLLSVIAVGVVALLIRSEELAIALFLIGMFVVILFLEPYMGLFIYVALLYIRPQGFIPALAGTHMMLVVGGATLVSMVIRRMYAGKPIRLIAGPADIAMWCLLACVLLSHFIHLDIYPGLEAAARTARLIVLYFLITNLVTTEKKLHAFMHLIGFCTIVLAVQGIVQYFYGVGISGQTVGDDSRIQSLAGFTDPNSLALGLLVGLAFLYTNTRGSRSLVGTIYSLLGVTVVLVALYLTNSRGGMIALAGMVAVVFGRRVGWRKGFVTAAVFAAGIYFLGPSRMSTISVHEPSAYGRVKAWDMGFRFFESSPLFGIGAWAWGSERYSTLVAHNSFIHCAAEMGVVGLFFWVMMVFVIMRHTAFIMKHAQDNRARQISMDAERVFVALVGFVLSALFLSKVFSPVLYILAGLAVATTNLYMQNSEHKFVLFDKKELLYVVFITIGGLAFLKIFVSWAKI